MQKYNKDWRIVTDVCVVCNNGSRYYYADLNSAVRGIGWYVISRLKKGFIGLCADDCEFRADGLLVPLWRVREAAMHLNLHNPPRHSWSWQTRNFVFRQGPVEGLRRSYRRRCGHHRYMQTFQERRENLFAADHDEELRYFGVVVRKARTHVLPNPWDDEAPTRYAHRSWKTYRGTQWK